MQVFSWLNCQVTNVSFGFFAVSYRKSFYFSLSQSIREQHRSFSHESAALDIHLPIPNSSVRFAENKKDPSLGGAVNCVFFVAVGRSQCFTPQILAELPPLHTGSDGWDHCVMPSVCFPGVA